MKAQTNKSEEHKETAVANHVTRSAGDAAQLMSMQPGALSQNNVREMANHSPQVRQLRSYQAMANDYVSRTAQKKEASVTSTAKQAGNTRHNAGGVVQRLGQLGMGLVGGTVAGLAGLALGGIPGALTGFALGAAAGAFIGGGSKPALSAADAGNQQEGPCGSFQRVRTWAVSNPVQGIIVQKVTRTFNVAEVNGNVLAGAAIDSYVTSRNSSVNATETQYWELWTVDAAGTVSDGGTDTFGLCAIINGRRQKNTTKGTFVMSGEAKFYPTNDFPHLNTYGFAKGAVISAGGLYSTFNNPDGLLPASSGPTVSYTVNVAWDSSKPDFYSQVT